MVLVFKLLTFDEQQRQEKKKCQKMASFPLFTANNSQTKATKAADTK
jgi:hypothetical protein